MESWWRLDLLMVVVISQESIDFPSMLSFLNIGHIRSSPVVYEFARDPLSLFALF